MNEQELKRRARKHFEVHPSDAFVLVSSDGFTFQPRFENYAYSHKRENDVELYRWNKQDVGAEEGPKSGGKKSEASKEDKGETEQASKEGGKKSEGSKSGGKKTGGNSKKGNSKSGSQSSKGSGSKS